ncbi:stalk domain-containing protein [Paenibacillus sp. D51F]
MKLFGELLRPAAALLTAPVLAAALLALPAAPAAAAAGQAVTAQAQPIVIMLDGKKLAVRMSPVILKGSILVPMKDIFKALGSELSWDPKTRTLLASSGGYFSMSLKVGASHAVVNGKSVKLDSPAVILNGTTFVPIRFVSETMGAEVKWDAKSRIVRISSEEAQLEAAVAKAEKERASRRLTTAQIVAKNDDSVVLIQTDYGQGSGVVAGPRLILTNLHVMKDAKSGKIMTNDGRSIDIQGVAATDEKNDLALVLTKQDMDLVPIVFGSFDDVQKGDTVVAIGSPLGLQNTVSEGLISNIGYDDGSFYYQVSTPIDHGSSGGGLFNQYGELIGLTTSGYDDTTADLNFATSSEDAENLLRTAKFDAAKVGFLKPSLPDSMEGASLDEIAALMKKEFGSIQGSDGNLALTGWKAERDAAGWLVIQADVNPDFYDYYGSKMQKDLRMWGTNTSYELHSMLPKEKIQLVLMYGKQVDFEPRGYAAGEATAAADGKWSIRYAVLDVQFKEDMLIKLRG